MGKILSSIMLSIIGIFSVAQTESAKEFANHICNIDGNSILINETNTKENDQVSNEIIEYLEQINFLFEQQYAKYTLLPAYGKLIASAYNKSIGNDYARIISVNEPYFSHKLSKSINFKPLFIWILTHELNHHINGDLYYDPNGIIANNYKKELIADERAGYAVGMLTNIDIDFFDQEIRNILSDNLQSFTHPPLKYRIMAAKGGWLRAKLKDQELFNSVSKYYKHENTSDKEQYGRYFDNNYNGIVFIAYQNKDMYIGNCLNGLKSGDGIYFTYDTNMHYHIYIGQWASDQKNGKGTIYYTNGDNYRGYWKKNLKCGEGTMNWLNSDSYNGNWKNDLRDGKGKFITGNGEIYEGDWKSDEKNGFGKILYPNGTNYRGNWLNNKRHGDGIFYKGNKVINAGCWYHDLYMGTECN